MSQQNRQSSEVPLGESRNGKRLGTSFYLSDEMKGFLSTVAVALIASAAFSIYVFPSMNWGILFP